MSKPISEVARKAVEQAFPKDAEDILKGVRWDSLYGCWTFNRWGMLVGIEEDGTIHS